MHWSQQSKKSLGFVAAILFVATGTYNAIVINADSSITSQDIQFVKRLDEVYGVVTPGRMLAASNWKKLNTEEVNSNPIVQVVNRLSAAPEIAAAKEAESAPVVAAAVQDELDLSLTEVINPKKFQKGLQADQFSGNLSTNNGVIESLSVSLPNGEGISVSFTEMTGNVFEYDLDGEVFSGMMYQVDQNSYMVTLSNGPLEGTRLRFAKGSTEEVQQEVQQDLEQNHQVETGNFGTEAPAVQAEAISQDDQAMQAEALQAQTYNMEQPLS
ncbi:MAG TPA: hypothetical protein VNJ08_10085 [Bacteriovoracaceae bacterium]|nr:hypothetical protein [Bacteriovoracaceae bacterium]